MSHLGGAVQKAGGQGLWGIPFVPRFRCLVPVSIPSCENDGVITESVSLVDVSTVVAAVATLWALALAWFTYFMLVRQQSKDELEALRSVVKGLSIELELMNAWTGAGGPGYLRTMTIKSAPPDWSLPDRLIWKFDIGAISNLTRSPYLYKLDDIVEPFARLNLSVSRLFQLYDEYRAFANGNPGELASPHQWYTKVIRDFNFQMHVGLIGGEDSPDITCLYHAYKAATTALAKFKANLKPRETPWWFFIGNVVCIMFVVAGFFIAGAFFLLEIFHC